MWPGVVRPVLDFSDLVWVLMGLGWLTSLIWFSKFLVLLGSVGSLVSLASLGLSSPRWLGSLGSLRLFLLAFLGSLRWSLWGDLLASLRRWSGWGTSLL
jgi:hypothetical protein